jgi:hypothetical protein
MTQKIGERELALRKQREDDYKAEGARPKTAVATLAAALPAMTGVKPVKRKKAKRREG